MTRLITLILLIASAVAQSTAPAKPAPIPEDDNGKKAHALINKAIEALGGQAYLTATTRGEEGRYYSFYHGESRGAGVQYRQFNRYPDQERFEMIKRGNVLVPLPLVGIIVVTHEVKDKNDMVIIHNGDKGYEITFKGTAAEDAKITSAFLRRRQHSLEWVLRKWISEPGVAFFYEGVTVAAQKPTEQISIMNNKDDSVTVFLDQNTSLPVKISYSWRDPDDKFRNVEEEIYDSYKPLQGIMTPLSVTRFLNGDMTVQRFRNTVSYNQELPADLFAAAVSYDPYKNSPKR
jgi:hypothetical protein